MIRVGNKRLLPYAFLVLFLSINIFALAPKASALDIRGHSQGSTMTKEYFIYATLYGGKAHLFRCKRSGTSISHCKNITPKVGLGHANAIDHQWGSNYFYVYDGWCNPRTKASCTKGCFDFNGKKVNNSKCGTKANNKYRKTNSTAQGYAQYKDAKGTYFLKGFSGPNLIQVYRNGKLIKTITGLKSGELEDVMVDGKTGKIYYTTSSNGVLHLYGYNGNILSPASGSSSSSSSGSSSGSGGERIGKHRIVDGNDSYQKNSIPATESHYDGTVDTVFFGTIKDNGDGCQIFNVLTFFIELITYGLGIAAIIGFSVAGIMYLTAKGSLEQTTRAKKRISEIIIGLVVYAVLWALLNFLLPGGKINPTDQCKDPSPQEVTAVHM